MTDTTRPDYKSAGSSPSVVSTVGGSSSDRASQSTLPEGVVPGAHSPTTMDFSKLQEDVAALKESLTKYVSSAGTEAARTIRDASESMGSQISGAASDAMEAGSKMASSASEQAKTFASEIEIMARKNPLGAMAGALVVGVLIGLLGRGRG